MVNITRYLDEDERAMMVQWLREQADILEKAWDISGVVLDLKELDDGKEPAYNGFYEVHRFQVRPAERQVILQYVYREGIAKP